MSGASDYGRDGIVGIGTPQANPTVEAEMAVLLPPGVVRVTTRLTSSATASEARLRDYLEGLDVALTAFDTLRPAVFGFACTASSYLVGKAREADIVTAAQALFGYPIVTAAAAILRALTTLDARRVALLSPYPPALGAAARRYWSGQGLTVSDFASIPTATADTRGIYALGSAGARELLAGIGAHSADAILITGTGIPSLPLIANPPPGLPPILSSNLALAQALLGTLGLPPSDWRSRLAAATGASA